MAPNSAMKVPVFPILLPPLIPSDKPPRGVEVSCRRDMSNKVKKKKRRRRISKKPTKQDKNLTNVSKPERQ